jgi:hypothetical protein
MNHPSPLHKSAFPAKTLGAGLRRKITGIARETQPSALAYVRMLLANKWLFLWITVALAVPAVAVIYKLTPIYRATATVLVEVSKSKVVSIDDVAVGPSANREYFQTQAEFLKSRDVALRVIRDLKLTEHPAFDPRQARTGPMAKLGSMLGPSGPDFDEETAEELQARAREFLDKKAAELDAKRVELGVEDAVLDVPGVTLAMAVALGEGGVKTVEDLADLATDEIRGGYEVNNGERVKVLGVLESFNLAQDDAELLILQARVAAGWIDASELPQPEPEYEDEGDYAEGEYDPDQVFGEAGGEGQVSDDAEPSNT